MADELSRLKPVLGSTKARKRLGRGSASGQGQTSGKGQKGQKSRSGGGVRPGFEGGQMPLTRRLAKRGFKNPFAKEYTEINVGQLEGRFEAGAEVDAATLRECGVISHIGKDGLKVLGGGDLTVALTVKASKFTRTAQAKIEGAGGTAEAI
jgi:large subunit ribosomal protein L15